MQFLHVKFIADFRTMLMACSGCQFGLCRQFTYRTIIPPTPSCDLEWIVQESWWSTKSGSIMSKSQILCVLARPLICRQRWISSDERWERPRIVKCWGGRSAPGNGGRLTPLGHRLERRQPQVEKRGGRFVRIAQNEVSSFPCFLSSCLVGLTLFLRASLR